MGTSTDYGAPGSWGPLKGAVTRAGRSGRASAGAAGDLLADFVQRNGGARAMAHGRGAGGTIGGSAGRAVALRLANFVSTVREVGIDEALRREGLSEFAGRPVQEILLALLDRLGGPSSTLDDVDARAALARLQDEYLAEAVDADDVEKILQSEVSDLDNFLARYFGFYLYEQFSRVFFERLVQRVGQANALSFLADIEAFIRDCLANRLGSLPADAVDWAGTQGARVCADIMQTTLEVFAG